MAVRALARRASQDARPARAPGVVVDRMNAMLGTGADMAPRTGGASPPAVNILEEAAWAVTPYQRSGREAGAAARTTSTIVPG